MKGVKIIGFSAAAGFLLSFVFGLFSRASIFSVLLKAVVFAAVFGGLGFLINFIYEKFLSGDSDFESETDDENKIHSGESSKTGQVVDITIQDEELDKGESENHFTVGNAYKMLDDSDIEKKVVPSRNFTENELSETENPAEEKSFVPSANTENGENVAEKETISQEREAAKTANVQSFGGGKNDFNSGGVDVLPEMEDFAFAAEETESDDNDVDTESDFVSSVNKKSASAPEMKNAELIAKAISSVLSDADSE